MPRGRKRDEDAQNRILEAAFGLVGTGGQDHVGVDDIAQAADVSKQTIYRWWPSRTAVILDALVTSSMEATPLPTTHDARADFRTHLRRVIRVFNSETGAVIRELISKGQADIEVANEFRDRFWGPRRELSLARLQRAIEDGQIRPDIEPETVLDALYGPLWLRLVIGHRPLRPRDADDIVGALWPGIAKVV